MIVRVDELLNAKKSVVDRLSQIQHQFKNASMILIGEIQEKEWLDFQLEMPGGLLRLYNVSTFEDAISLIHSLHEMMKQKDRFEKQTVYLDLVQKENSSHGKATAILQQCLQELEIDERDILLIVQHFRSISRLVSYAHDLPNIPSISKSAMEKIKIFFDATTPSLKEYYQGAQAASKPISALFKPTTGNY